MKGYSFNYWIQSIDRCTLEEAKELIRQMKPPEWDKRALQWAVYKGYIELIEFLLARMSDADINAVSNSGQTVLHFAAFKGQTKATELLLVKMNNESINTVNVWGYTAFQIAAEMGYEETAKLLAEHTPTDEILSLINHADYYSATIDMLCRLTVKFMNERLFTKEAFCSDSIACKDYSKFKIYQALKEKDVTVFNSFKFKYNFNLARLDNFIKENYLQLAGICKENKNSELREKLPNEMLVHIFSFLDLKDVQFKHSIESITGITPDYDMEVLGSLGK